MPATCGLLAACFVSANYVIEPTSPILARSLCAIIGKFPFHGVEKRRRCFEGTGRQVVSDLPAGVPHQAANAARDTLGGALAAARQLPDETGAALIGTAREAFGQAFETTAIICAVVALAAAMLATILLRGVGNGAGHEPQSEPDGGDDGSSVQQAVVAER